MSRIGYIPMVHWHYDSTEPAEEPVRLYWDADEADRIALKAARGEGVSPVLLEVVVQSPE